MVCPTCGASFEGIGNFCPQCGARVTGAAPFPPPGYVYQAPPTPGYTPPGYVPPPYPGMAGPRVLRNLQLLSILWGCFAAYLLLGGLLGLAFVHSMAHGGFFGRSFPFGAHGGPFFSALLPFALMTTLALVGLSALVAYGLMQRRPWGRTLAIVMSILSMLKFPLGTALGIYTLWVLAPAASAMEYETIADRTTPGL